MWYVCVCREGLKAYIVIMTWLRQSGRKYMRLVQRAGAYG